MSFCDAEKSWFQKHSNSYSFYVSYSWGFPGGSVGKESTYNAGDLGLNSGSERYLEKGNGNPFQYSCLKNPMNRGAWRATVHGVARVGHIRVTKPPPHFTLTTPFSSVQSLSRVLLFMTPWTTACQASLSITNSQSLLKLISIE